MAQKAIDPKLKFVVVELFEQHRFLGIPSPTIREVHLHTGVSMDACYRMMRALANAGVIPRLRRPGGAQKWLKRPYSSKPSAVRQRAWRKKKAAELLSSAASNATREERITGW